MKKITLFAFLFVLLSAFTIQAQVIISQIYEGSSNNKFIEITNLGTTPVDLASPQLTLKLFSNKEEIGANAPTNSLALTGTLAAGQCFVIWNTSAANPAYALAYTPGIGSNVCNFNGIGTGTPSVGTDIIALYNGSTLVDVFAWGSFTYNDQSYHRNLSVSAPNATWTVAEWTTVSTATVDAAAAGTIERLGYHGAVSTNPSISISSPTNGSTIYVTNVNVSFSVYNFTIGTDGYIKYTVDGGSPANHNTSNPISITGLTNGSHTVVLTLVDNGGNPLSPNVSANVTFTVNLAGPTITTIYDIQYTTLPNGDSPLKDSVRTTTGIVTAAHTSGYFIQTGNAPWNGLYVYDNTHTPALGDSIVLKGTIAEYYNFTELKTITDYSTIATGKPLPLPINLNTLQVKNEQYEGMLVKITNAACTYVHSTGWWKVVQNVTDTLEIGKLMFPFPTAAVGTAYNVTGCVNYSFSEYKIEPRNAADIEVFNSIADIDFTVAKVFPNPATDILNIQFNDNVQQVILSNILGEVNGIFNVNDLSASINISNLKSGIYFIRLVKDNDVISGGKFIKK